MRARFEAGARRLGAWQTATFRRESMRVERLRARLEPANVAKLLSRGFSLVLHAGHVVSRSAQAAEGDDVRIALGEGWVDARVTSCDTGEDPLPGGTRPPRDDAASGSGGAAIDPLSRRR
jgi:exodeoxyribonuclease VII large subunit